METDCVSLFRVAFMACSGLDRVPPNILTLPD